MTDVANPLRCRDNFRPIRAARVIEYHWDSSGYLPHGTVFFQIGSAELSPREIMNLSYLAEQMKQFPNATYTVNGYADSATGTPAFNKELSLKRAQAVKNALVKNYGIAADRLNVEAGGGVDKFGQPILNRVVLVKSAN